MKNIKIFPKDWLQLHPYKQSTPVDSYYTDIFGKRRDAERIVVTTAISWTR